MKRKIVLLLTIVLLSFCCIGVGFAEEENGILYLTNEEYDELRFYNPDSFTTFGVDGFRKWEYKGKSFDKFEDLVYYAYELVNKKHEKQLNRGKLY